MLLISGLLKLLIFSASLWVISQIVPKENILRPK